MASQVLHIASKSNNVRLRHWAAGLGEMFILKIIKPTTILFRDRNRLKYFLYPGADWLYEYAYCHGYHEVAEQEFCKQYVEQGMMVIDVGAQYGQYTLLFSNLVGSGCVHAFEPSSHAFKRLTQNLAINKASNVVANRVAVFSERGTVSLQVYELVWSGCNSLAKRRIVVNGKEIKPVREESVEMVTLDEYSKEHALQHIDFLKIDVEGVELEVLRGANNLLANGQIDCIMFEVGITTEDYVNRRADVPDHLAHYGYKIFCFTEDRLISYPCEHTEPLERTNLVAIREDKLVRKEIFGPYENKVPKSPLKM